MFNKNKLEITEDNYKEVMLKRAIISCWIILIICFIIKLFGGNFFEIICNSKGFIKVCDFIDKTFLVYVLQIIVFAISSYIIFKCIDFNCSNKITILKVLIYFLVWIIKHLQSINIISINIYIIDIIDFLAIYLLSIVFCKSKNKFKYLKPLIILILLFIFTMISSITKNIGLNGSLNNSSLTSLIFMIDYYIMLILTYLYQKRRYLKWVLGESFTGLEKT